MGIQIMQNRILFLVVVIVLFLTTLPTTCMASNAMLSNLKSFTAGGVGGVMSVLVGHPLDLVKVRMQTSAATTATVDKDGKKIIAKTKKPEGTFEILGQILKQEGFVGMYRGVGAPILAVAPIWATSFWGFDTGLKLVRSFCNLGPEAALSIPQLCLAGGFSAFPTALVMVPSERIKCILQTQKDKYAGMRDCACQIYKESGMRGLYKGTTLTLMRDIPANMVYFGIYEIVKQKLATQEVSMTASALVAGAMAGIFFWPVALPMDTLKSRYQTAEEGRYKHMGDVYTEVVKEDGMVGLFKGMGPAMIRSAPANAVSFLGAEMTKKFLSFMG